MDATRTHTHEVAPERAAAAVPTLTVIYHPDEALVGAAVVAQARGGTLFLDEVADASPALEGALLHLLEARRFRPVGADRELETDARVVVACQSTIDAKVDAGTFRLDLWNRVARWVIEVPPLRERADDIPLLALRVARQLTGEPGLTLAEPPGVGGPTGWGWWPDRAAPNRAKPLDVLESKSDNGLHGSPYSGGRNGL